MYINNNISISSRSSSSSSSSSSRMHYSFSFIFLLNLTLFNSNTQYLINYECKNKIKIALLLLLLLLYNLQLLLLMFLSENNRITKIKKNFKTFYWWSIILGNELNWTELESNGIKRRYTFQNILTDTLNSLSLSHTLSFSLVLQFLFFNFTLEI